MYIQLRKQNHEENKDMSHCINAKFNNLQLTIRHGQKLVCNFDFLLLSVKILNCYISASNNTLYSCLCIHAVLVGILWLIRCL